VLDQLSAVPTASAKFANRCRDAVDLISRGVVSYSSITYQSIEEDFDDDVFDGS
jgi:ATP-dependent RNA helicase HelY